jgi:hypothetical protein
MGSEGGTEAVSVAVNLAARWPARRPVCDKFLETSSHAPNKGAVKEGARPL